MTEVRMYPAPLSDGERKCTPRRDAAACWLFAFSWILLGALDDFRTIFDMDDVNWCTDDFFVCMSGMRRRMVAAAYPVMIAAWMAVGIERASARCRRLVKNGDADQLNGIVICHLIMTLGITVFLPATVALIAQFAY